MAVQIQHKRNHLMASVPEKLAAALVGAGSHRYVDATDQLPAESKPKAAKRRKGNKAA